jgi:hypothetical protein
VVSHANVLPLAEFEKIGEGAPGQGTDTDVSDVALASPANLASTPVAAADQGTFANNNTRYSRIS